MKKRIKYTDEPMELGERIYDLLPSPEELARGMKKTKITLEITGDSAAFFKKQAKKYGVPYQAMIRELLDEYAQRAGKD
ncbi:MAG: BrnA antitoxin family protein [Alphaproteobacteria bacterium]|nr:BrnA antitoxin family protein [Alphaproteobacteria bacterium]